MSRRSPTATFTVASSEPVGLGSDTTDVGVEAQEGDGGSGAPIKILDADGNTVHEKCKFNGKRYNENPGGGPGRFGGELNCEDDIAFQCERPDDNRATTCSDKPAGDCGHLGKDCPERFFQLLALCRF